MTLVQYKGGGHTLVAIASDTRQILTVRGTSIKTRVQDSENKSGRLSKYVLCGAGGLNRPIDRVKELVVEFAGGAEFLEDYVLALEKAIDIMRSDWRYKDEVNEDTCFQIIIAGFNSDGSTGHVVFTSGKDAKVERVLYEKSKHQSLSITPSKDECDIIDSVKFIHPKKAKELPQKIIEHFATIQKACFINDPDNVSEKCVYSVIFRNPNTREIKWYEGSINVEN